MLLPYDAVLNGKDLVTHMEISKNDKLKVFEISFFENTQLVSKYFYKDILIKVVDRKMKYVILLEENKVKKNKIDVTFTKSQVMSEPKKMIEKMLI